ncbi:MAG TPA: glycine-rich domain-containing protein-like [Candidatus Nanoarchaeia archaeon]|nr:glycine-rich domain-containing protein-like [Candidatus Nanoarchaeia archaeon]
MSPQEAADTYARRNTSNGNPDFERRALLIQSLDLSKIINKVKEKQGWTDEQATDAECKYRQYLYMGLKYEGVSLVPSKDIDEVWHAHILDTKKYMVDCQAIFGRFIHHVPNYGVHSTGENNVAQIFNALWQLEFGVLLFGVVGGYESEENQVNGVDVSSGNFKAECLSQCSDCRTDCVGTQ